ncbi:hypothetical protein [Synechococcus phage DSL-LC03]|nr:hypothetical protein [Synechococcus phage DSL-LC03]
MPIKVTSNDLTFQAATNPSTTAYSGNFNFPSSRTLAFTNPTIFFGPTRANKFNISGSTTKAFKGLGGSRFYNLIQYDLIDGYFGDIVYLNGDTGNIDIDLSSYFNYPTATFQPGFMTVVHLQLKAYYQAGGAGADVTNYYHASGWHRFIVQDSGALSIAREYWYSAASSTSLDSDNFNIVSVSNIPYIRVRGRNSSAASSLTTIAFTLRTVFES